MKVIFIVSPYRYKFILTLENAICRDYVTEKLWQALHVGSIPIYLGAPNIRDHLPQTNTVILVSDFRNVATLAERINFLDGNDVEYKKMLQHKAQYAPGDR